jgi:hypothetical protein
MTSRPWARRLAVVAVSTGLIGLTAACGTSKEEAPTTTTTTTTTTTQVTPSPTEKGLNPGGGNKFTPDVKAPPAPTAIPGDN